MILTEKNADKKPIFLDIKNKVGVTHDEEGLLSLAFHPDFEENGELYVWYSAQRPKRSVLSRFTYNSEGVRVNAETEEVLLEVREPWGNHNGGTVMFGPDGFLYLGIGDGGAANDPHRNGQNNKTLLGTIIRIDVNNSTESAKYAIPKDNPLVSSQDARHEIWAWGLRNPWRMSFDRTTGELWTGDVGQNAWEEIDVITKGGNYGWNAREGRHNFLEPKTTPTTVDPVHEYGRRSGGSITGGYVYRGTDIPNLSGGYIFADYISRRTWILTKDEEGEESYAAQQIAKKTPLSISSFGETPDGEIIVCGFVSPYASTGKMYRLVQSPDSTTSTIR